MRMPTSIVLIASALALAACASGTPPPQAGGPLDWSRVAEVGTPEIVTLDPDGDERLTKLWLVVVDGQGFIRTSGTRWLRNLERDPDLVLRIEGLAYPLRAEPVGDRALHARVNQAFRDKYGLSDFLIHPRKAPGSTVLRLVPRPAGR
jgi:hypothetical protein